MWALIGLGSSVWTQVIASKVANTCEVFILPTSSLAASFAEFELFMSFAGLLGLTQKFLSTCENIRRWSTKSLFKGTRFTIIYSQMAEFLMHKSLSADVVQTAVAITQNAFHKIWRWVLSSDKQYVWKRDTILRPAFISGLMNTFGVLQAVNAQFV